MAESISEGTLKQWSKQIGDYVEQDEEIATIETDKVCLPVWPLQWRLTDLGGGGFLDRRCSQCTRSRHHQGVPRK
jgi:hypothetical protein